jgi:hypothetical protein
MANDSHAPPQRELGLARLLVRMGIRQGVVVFLNPMNLTALA